MKKSIDSADTLLKSVSLMDGALRLYRRNEAARYWQCETRFQGRKYRESTKEENFQLAKEFAKSWYLKLLGQSHAGLLKKSGKTFDQAADQFLKEYEIITDGERSPKWVEGHVIRLRVHLRPFFGEMLVNEITASKVQEYRVHRMTVKDEKPAESKSNRPHKAKAPARKTIHNEIVTLRQVLKTALRHDWITHLPELSVPYKSQGKIVHRPWFSPSEYKSLYEATRENIKVCREQDKWAAEQLHDFVLFLANTGLRPETCSTATSTSS